MSWWQWYKLHGGIFDGGKKVATSDQDLYIDPGQIIKRVQP
jgi:hypothetical protein